MVCPGLVGIGDPRTMKLAEGMPTQGLPEGPHRPHPEYAMIFLCSSAPDAGLFRGALSGQW